jgi:hypothetical protein
MSGRPTWGFATVTGLAGFATGLLVAAMLIAGRPAPRSVETPSPTTTTSVVEVTVQTTTSTTSVVPTSTSPALPLTSIWRD